MRAPAPARCAPARGSVAPRRGRACKRPSPSWPGSGAAGGGGTGRRGPQRILEIAGARAADRVLLVLDEPAAGLRRQEKLALAGLLRKLRGEGLTILLVEHDMDFVMHLVDRLVVMNFGAKLIEGTPAAVRADARVQAAYLGSME